MDQERPKVLVTGGTGTIGPKVVSQLLARGWCVTTVSRNAPVDSHSNLSWKKVDLLADSDWKGLTAGHELVLHMANLSKTDLAKDRHVASALAQDARNHGVKYFFYTSSIRIFGNSKGVVWDDAPPRPHAKDTYGINKVKVEEILRATLRGSATRLFLLRVGDVITEQKFASMPKSLSLKGLMMWGRARPHFIHVNDVARAIEFLLESRSRLKNDRFNLTRELSGPSTYYDYFASKLPLWKRILGKVMAVPREVPRLLYRNRTEAFGARGAMIAEANLVNEGLEFVGEDLTQLLHSGKLPTV